MTETVLYKNTTSDLNQGWRDLLKLYGRGDCKLSYLQQFEAILSQCIPDEMLWQDDVYKSYREQYMPELPESPRAAVPPGVFWNFLMLYEQLMRKAGLIDKAPIQQDVTLAMFDLGDD